MRIEHLSLDPERGRTHEPQATYPERPWEIEERATPTMTQLNLGAAPESRGPEAVIDLGESRRIAEDAARRAREATQ